MTPRRQFGAGWCATGMATLCGVVLAAGCEAEDLQAVVAGLEAATQVLEEQQTENDEVGFREWLVSELDD